MAEEFVEIEQGNDPLGILSEKKSTTKIQGTTPVDNDPLGILKKKSTPVVSSGIPSQLPSQPDFLQQGQNIASGKIFTDISESVPKATAQPVVKQTLKDAALKDKENNGNYLAALYNIVVSGAQTFAGGAARLNQKFSASPIDRIQETADRAASSVTGINYEAQREKEAAERVRNLVGNVRSNASSKEYEKKLIEGFNVTNGIGLDDIKALGVILPSILGDVALGTATGGTSFAIQGYDNALSTIDDIPEAKNMSETTRTAFGLGGAVIAGVLEKLGMDNILKSGTATKYVTSKILKEASEELAKKGAKVTAEQFQKTVSDKATQLLTKTALKNTVKAGAKSALVEGATEATQEGAMDLMKLAANQIENKKIFDEEEIKNTAASRYLNSAVMGGIFGGVGGAAMSRTKNLQRYIQDEIKNAKTQQDIDNLVNDINQNVQEGVLSQNDAEVLKSMVDENISKPSDLDIKNEKETKLSEINGEIALLNKEDRLYNENLEKLNKRKEEVNSYYDNLAKESKKVDEVVSDDGTPVPVEEAATEVKVTENIEDKKADIEKRRKEELDTVIQTVPIEVLDEKGNVVQTSDKKAAINAKYDAELSALEGGKTGAKASEAKTVEQLRAEEQAELDSKIPNAEQYRVNGKVDRTKLTNEEDIKAFDEVYNKYDKLISPLLEKPAEQKITVELLSSQEPPQKEGETIVTLSGKTEKERLESIERRQSSTKVTDKVLADNALIQRAQSYFKKTERYKNTPEGRAELNKLRLDGRDLGLTVDTERNKVTVPSKKTGRPRKVAYNNKADSDAIVESSGKTLTERNRDVQEAFEELTDAGVFLDIKSESGNRMSAAQIDAAVSDILEGIPSKAANKYLDALEKGLAEDAIPLYDKGMGGFAPKLADIRAQLGIEKEVVGEPMDEAALNKFLDEESKLTPEEEQDLLDNVENLLYEYETTEAGPEGKVQPTEAGAKERVPSEAKPSEPTKSERQAEYEKIKSNKKKKDFVRNNLPEEFKPLADELTEAQMSEIVDSNFDSKTIKNIQDAIQKQGAAEVLQRKQEGDGGTGGGRKRVEQGKQGDEPTGEGKAKTAEEAQPKGTEEGEVIGITHEQLNEVARELDFPEYEASPETIEQWDARAKEELAKGPEAVNNLIAKYEKNILPEPWEQRMMLMIISSAKAKINANPSPENLAQFKRIMELSNNVGGRVVAQSLRARQGVKQVADTLPDFLLMRENDRGYPFTESEIKEQAKVFEELKKEKDALKDALQKSEEANAKLIAEMGVNKAKAAAKKAAKKTREEYVIERKQSLADAREALKKLRTGEQGVTAVVVPGFRELKAVSPHVKNYIKSLVEEGANKLDDIVNDTYAEFKDILDGITKKDILDIFNGEYDESKPRTRNEKAEELRLLQREAALVKELENVRKGIEKEKNPAQKVKKNDRITELEDKIKEVKRLNKERDRVPQEFTEPEFALKTEGELLASKRKMLTKRIEKLQDDIKNKRYLEEKKAPPKLELDRKTQLLKDRVIKMEREIEAERQKDAYKKMSKTEKYFNHFNQITGIRRVMQTAFDLSVSLRQGVLVAFNPRKWDVFSKAFGNQMKSVFSDKKFNSLMYDIHNSSEYNKMLEDGIKFNELDALKNEERNEDFQKSFLYGIKIPVVRQLITEPLLASQRAADGFLNTARYELYLKYEKQLLKQGITRQSDPEAYKKMADLVMNMTGRGKLISHLESGKWNKVVSNTFYGARLMAANINSLNPVKYYKLPPGVRKEVMKDMLSYVTTTAGIMLAASAAGATVELDPDKPDFLQIRKDDKVYDITGGKAAYLRTFFRMVSGLYSRVTDNKYTYGKKLERAGTSITNFFRNKLAPNVGYGVNMLYGENTLNQDFDPYEALEAYPMYADDFAEALKDEGITSLATVLAPNILGIGYGSYANQANKESLESSLERMLNSDEMNPELIKNHKDGDRQINNKEFDDLVKLRDAKIEKEIRSLYDGKSKFNLILDKGNVVTKKVKDMTEEEVKKAKKSIASEATRLSKEQLFGKEKKTREEKMEDKRLSRARKRFD
jgi:hypothetical protein